MRRSLLVVLLAACGPSRDAARTDSAAPAPGSASARRDIEPGVYAAEGGPTCYWSRSSDASGAIASIVANHFGAGPVVADIAAEDVVFRSEGCGTWVRQ